MNDYRCWRCLQDLGWEKFMKAKVAVTLIDGNALCTDHAKETAEQRKVEIPDDGDEEAEKVAR